MKTHFGKRERRTLILFLLILATFIAIGSSLIYVNERQERISRATMHAEHEMKLISKLIAESLTRSDYITVKTFIDQWARERPDLVAVKLTTASGFILASHARPQTTRYPLPMKRSITYGDQGSASMEMIWDTGPIYKDLNTLITVLVTIYLVLVAVLLAFMWWVLGRTLLKPLHNELDETEFYNHMLFESSPIGLALCRMNGELVDINAAYANIIGRTVGETLQLSYWDITPDKYIEDEKHQMELLNTTGQYGPYEKEYIHKDGHRVPVRLHGRLLEKGGETFIWSSIEDITEHKRIVQTLQSLASQSTAAQDFENFLHEALANLTEFYGCKYALVAQLLADGKHVRTLAVRAGAEPTENFEYDLMDTPCQDILDLKLELITQHASKLYPDDKLLVDMGVDSYYGTPLCSADGTMLGLISVMDTKAMAIDSLTAPLLKIVASRITLEIGRLNSEQALHDSERRLSTLMASLPGMAYRCLNSPPWTVLFISDACKAITGYAAEDLINDNKLAYTDLIHPDDTDRVWHTVQNAVKQGVPFHIEYRIRNLNGDWRWVQEQGRMVSAPGEQPGILEGYIADITEQHRMSEEIRGAQRQLQELLDDMQTMTGIMDPDGTITFINNTPLILADIEANDVLGKKAWECIWFTHSTEAQEAMKADVIKAASGESILHDMQIYTPNGLLWIEFSTHPVFDAKGKVKQLVAEGRDISLRKQAENELTEQRDFNNTVVEAAGNAIVILDTSGNIVTFNRAAEELTGFHREELSGQPIWDWVIPEEQKAGVQNVFDQLIQGKLNIAGQYTNDWLTRDGSRRTLDWHNTILSDESGKPTHVVALGYDVTERLLAENELKQLNATLETRVKERTHELQLSRDKADAANQAKSNFLSNMSHEIRSPLAAIIGFSDSLKTDDFNEQEREKIISTIVRNGKHLQQIINDILDLSKIEADQLEVEFINTSVFTLMGEINSLLGMSARDKGLEFKITYQFPLLEKIVTDPTLLKQVLINLCSNAIKFTSEGFIEVKVSYDSDLNLMQFTVSDTGIGMTPEETLRVFDPFAQADNSTTRKYGGTGLGLSISGKFAAALGGSLACESSKGKGSRFTLTISNHDENTGEVINSLEEVSIYFDDQQLDIKPLSGSILLVEDIPDNQQLVSMYIRKTGAHLTIAENGKQAIEQAQKQDFDLILMDMQMPVMDGLEAIRRLRDIGYKHPIVSLTANALLSDREKCVAAGADGYLVKPIELYQFYHILNKYLAEDTNQTSTEKDKTLQKTMQDSPQYKAMVNHFLDKLPQMLVEIDTACATRNWDDLLIKSHDLKGMGGAMGYPEITELAAQLNTLVKQQNYELLADACAELDKSCRSILHNNSVPKS